MSVSCLNCGFVLEDKEHDKPCPKCGSRDRSITVSDKGRYHELLKLRKKETAHKKHKHKFDQEIVTGEKIGEDGKLVSIERLVNREQNVYEETVKDEHGQVIVQKDERLSEHR